jgi:hypothetical protein
VALVVVGMEEMKNSYSSLIGKKRRENIVTIIFCNDFQFPKVTL